MAASHSDYKHGEMEVKAQEGAFAGFMNISLYSGAFIALIVLYPTLIFGVNMSWLSSLMTTFIFGIILGVALKLKGGWYASLVGLAFFAAIIRGLIAIFM